MHNTLISLAALLVAPAIAAPAPTEYGPPAGGWESVKYPPGTGANLPYYPPPPGGWENVKYPPGTGENLPYYPPPPGGWEGVKYPPGTGSGHPGEKIKFTSVYYVKALGSEVVNGTENKSTPGPKDAVGYFNYGINAHEDLICWSITLYNVVGAYKSPAKTATHIHEGAKGKTGPPRIAFPNPVGDDKMRKSVGCMNGPFTTGVAPTGVDTGAGFKVSQIEANPAGFFTDSHTELFVPGVVRGQLD